MRSWKIGIQLYTIRGETSKDFVGALRKVAEAGFEGVEFAGYGGLEAERMKALLDELGLQAIGSHVGIDRLTRSLDEEIAYVKAIGGRYLICPHLGNEYRKDDETWRETFAKLESIGRRCAEQEIVFCYHNHDFELRERVGGQPALDAMAAAVPAQSLQFELDACWVHHAGCSPTGYIAKYKGRLPLVHFKDMRKTEEGKAQTVELGQGEVDLPAIEKAAAAAGVEWLIYEQDECQNPPFTAMANSMDWLKRNVL